MALAGSGGASASPPVGSCPASKSPFKLYPVSSFVDAESIDRNQNGFLCAFALPPIMGGQTGFFQVIDDVAQVP